MIIVILQHKEKFTMITLNDIFITINDYHCVLMIILTYIKIFGGNVVLINSSTSLGVIKGVTVLSMPGNLLILELCNFYFLFNEVPYVYLC